MWAHSHQLSTKRGNGAFTIVELLIVIVVIAILAAITIVAFNGVQDRARASSAAQAVSQAGKKVKVWQVEKENQSPTCSEFFELLNGTIVGAPTGTCIFDFKGTSYQYSTVSPGNYCVTTTIGNRSYKISETTPATLGGCPGHNQGGVTAITNWAFDPNVITSMSNFATSGSSVAPSTNSIATDRAHLGTTSLKKVISASAAQGTGAKAFTPTLTANGGETLSWSMWVYSTRAGTIIPIAEAYRISDGVYTNCVNTAASVPANSWTQIVGSCSMNANVNVAGAGSYNLQVQAGDTVWFDEFMITKGSSSQYNYADGNSPDWTWNGAVNNATSTGPPQ